MPLFSLRTGKTINISRDMTAASGNVSYTGLGFRPVALYLRGIISGTTLGSEGYASGSLLAQQYSFVQYGAAMLQATAANACLSIPGDTGITTVQAAVLASFDSDGFTLTWTKTGAPPANTATIFVNAV